MTDPGDNRPPRYLDGDKIVYRASSLGSCPRLLVATTQKYTPRPHPEWFQKVLDEGTIMESVIQARWDEATEIPTTNQQMSVELEVCESNGKHVVVRGHIDGVAGVGNTLREFKKVRPSGWKDWNTRGVEFLPLYPWQVSAYMHACPGYDMELVGGLLGADEWGELRIDDTHVVRLEEPPLPLKAIIKRVVMLEGLIDSGWDAREVKCDKSMYPCPYWEIHDEKEDEEYELPMLGDAAGLARQYIEQHAEAGREITRLKKELERWDKQKQTATEGLRASLGALGPEAEAAKRLVTEEYQVTRTRRPVKAHVTKAYDLDYFTIKHKEDKK